MAAIVKMSYNMYTQTLTTDQWYKNGLLGSIRNSW